MLHLGNVSINILFLGLNSALILSFLSVFIIDTIFIFSQGYFGPVDELTLVLEILYLLSDLQMLTEQLSFDLEQRFFKGLRFNVKSSRLSFCIFL
jgi:hypothetical protein